ncbi:CCA tRNA nucleotidyltransferase [Vagococcus vulneris]|uniref:CCA tRNA nucleotidyltransferase n=1 Tax=Vagococcus vulneris TaxID=1977869 RepID=UPI003B82C7A0
MEKNDFPEEFKAAAPIIQKIKDAGYEAYFVGGSVRDIILGQKIHDVDIATSAYPQEIKAIFNRTIDVGIEHGTVLVLWQDNQYEVTTFRTESTYQDFRRPDKVTFVRSLIEDLKRRDFTMNALAMTETGEIIDLFNGIEAIEKKQIKAVGNPHERFSEDALRMMRGLRFASQLGFIIEEETFAAIVENSYLLEKISIERICIEWVKLMLGRDAATGVGLFIASGCNNFCPGMSEQLFGLNLFQNRIHRQIKTEELAWALLMDSLNVANTAKWMKSWKLPNKLIQSVSSAMLFIKKRRECKSWSVKALYQAGFETVTLVEQLLEYTGESGDCSKYQYAYQDLPIHSLQDLAISGNDLLIEFDLKPGKWLGDILSKLADAVLFNQLPNEKKCLLNHCKEELLKNV